MSVVTLPEGTAPHLTDEYITSLATKAGIIIPEDVHEDFRTLLSGLDVCAQEVMALDDYIPKVDYERYPRTDIHIPDDTNKGGWATKATVKSVAPINSLLEGKTVALKDNIALAGVRCTNGTAALDWTPNIDATIVTRILDAGATITGKAACENACFGAVSDTSVTGPVHNPYADGYSCGGSSSGSGRLVAVGDVDMAIGCDQGGSIRLPAANCGLVGLKPTWGLVPYTGIISLEATIDHAGPMTRTVRDCAMLLEAIAGADGIDDRQPHTIRMGDTKYTVEIDALPQASQFPLKGLRIGVLVEGFQDRSQDANVARVVKEAATKLAQLGAQVEDCSIPLHRESAKVWMCALPIAGTRQGILSDMTGRKQLFLTDRVVATGRALSQAAFDALGAGGQNIYLRGLFLQDRYGPEMHARCMNLLRKLNDSYDAALKDYDVLVMPTLPFPPVPLFKAWNDRGPLERLSRTIGVTTNTAPFNSSGHPALTLPVGFSPAQDDENVKLPVGMQIVGRKWEDLTCLKVAAAWEKEWDWKQQK